MLYLRDIVIFTRSFPSLSSNNVIGTKGTLTAASKLCLESITLRKPRFKLTSIPVFLRLKPSSSISLMRSLSKVLPPTPRPTNAPKFALSKERSFKKIHNMNKSNILVCKI